MAQTIDELIASLKGESIEKTAMPIDPMGANPQSAPGSNLAAGDATESAVAGQVVKAVMDAKEQVVQTAPDQPSVDQTAGTPEDQAMLQADALLVAAGTDLQVRSDARVEEDTNTNQVVGGKMEGVTAAVNAEKAASEEDVVDAKSIVKEALQELMMEEKTAEEEAAQEEEQLQKMAEDAMAYGALMADGFIGRLQDLTTDE